MRSVGGRWRGWMLSMHGSMYGQFVHQGTQRGDSEFGVFGWGMGMTMRPLAGGMFQVRAMTSVEALVNGGDGYPLLLQTGGTFKRGYVHDRHHPHDLIAEASVAFERPVGGRFTTFVYAAPVGEPSLGPVAFMHRPSAENDPLGPLGHHWQDATHGRYGVATLGLTAYSFKVEASAFNARESDYERPWPDFRGWRLDSYAGRVTWTAARIAASTWWGYITAHDLHQPDSPMHRYGASLMSHLPGIRGGHWATTAIWSMNLHHHAGSSHALLHGASGASPHHHSSSLLAESNLEIGSRTALFGRAERVVKNGEELGFLGGDLTERYVVRSAVAGVRRQVLEVGRFQLAVGGRAALNFVPRALELTYGTMTPKGIAIFAQVRPK